MAGADLPSDNADVIWAGGRAPAAPPTLSLPPLKSLNLNDAFRTYLTYDCIDRAPTTGERRNNREASTAPVK